MHPSAPFSAHPFKDVKLLIVDDNKTNREILEQQLKNCNMDIRTVQSASEGLQILLEASEQNTPYKVGIIDMMMPEMNGLELVKKIRGYTQLNELRILMLTSHLQTVDAKELAAQNISYFLTKPVKQSELFDCLQTLIQEDLSKSTNAEIAPPIITIKPARKNFRILVVEDNLVNQKVEVLQLERLGYSPDVVSSGLEALDVLAKSDYDLILMDCQMPGMDGYEATAQIRKKEAGIRHTPIVAITAHAMQGDYEKCIHAGMDDYIPKPIKMDVLAKLLEKWTSPFDQETINKLHELEGDSNPNFFNELVGVFLNNVKELLSQLKEAVQTGDFETVKKVAHSLKGSSGSLGALKMMDLCKLIEKCAQNKEPDPLNEALKDLVNEFEYIQHYLEKQ